MNRQSQSIEVNNLRLRRDYIFIDDVVEAVILSISGKPGIYNIGSGYSTSVKELISSTLSLIGSDKLYVDRSNERQNEIFDLYADISQAKLNLNREPLTTLHDGLNKCIEFKRKLIQDEDQKEK